MNSDFNISVLATVSQLHDNIAMRPSPELLESDQILSLVIVIILVILMFVFSLIVNILIISIHVNNHTLKTVSNRYIFVLNLNSIYVKKYMLLTFFEKSVGLRVATLPCKRL